MLDKTKKPEKPDDVPEEGETRHTDPSTSKEAAASIDAKWLRWRAWRVLRDHGGWMNYFEWGRASGIPYSSITPRGRWLIDNKWVEVKIKVGLNAQGNPKNLMYFRAKV